MIFPRHFCANLIIHNTIIYIHLIGIAVAGETISTSAEGDMARALESIINPATNSEDNDRRGTDTKPEFIDKLKENVVQQYHFEF